jgi:Coproporphyrinogen III oxidase and related Fe-S oxidoreductases
LAERFGAESFRTMYVGGGTPTVLSAEPLDRLLLGLSGLAGKGLAEWTVEANPDSLSPEKLEIFSRRGVTRISLGVQSLDEDELALLGRRHSSAEAIEAVELAAGAGFRVSADLIAGIPSAHGLSRRAQIGALADSGRRLIDAGARHLSVYDLTLEAGTPLASHAPDLGFPSEDELCDSRSLLEEALAETGMRRYEVSNYAAPGDECLHNLAYWRMDSYLGAGPGAVSTIVYRLSAERPHAPDAVADTIASLRIEEGRVLEGYATEAPRLAAETALSTKDSAFEAIMMAYRTAFGLDPAAFRERFGFEAGLLIGRSLAAWQGHLVPAEPWPGRARSKEVGRRLDGPGLDILNRFLSDCLSELERAFTRST